MIPNQNSITYENMKPMLIQVYAGLTKYGYLNIESLDENLFFMYESDTDFPIMEQVIHEGWVHTVPLLPDPKLNRALWDLVKLYERASREGE